MSLGLIEQLTDQVATLLGKATQLSMDNPVWASLSSSAQC